MAATLPPSAYRDKSGYLPSLDGWRSFAIGVLLTHDLVRHIGPLSTSFLHRFGGYGVHLFFAISGILICTRLLEEEAIVGRIDLKGFYTRRILRIQPAALVYLTAVSLLTLLGWIHEHWRYLLGAVFLYRNYLWDGNSDHAIANGFFTGHFWSLAVEEHFYILLSFLLVGVARRWRLRMMTFLVLLLSFWQHYSPHNPHLYISGITDRHTQQVLNLLLIPSIFAVLLQRPRIRALALQWLRPWSTSLAAICIYGAIYTANRFFFYPHMHRLVYSSRPDFMVALAPFLIISTMLHPGSWSTRISSSPSSATSASGRTASISGTFFSSSASSGQPPCNPRPALSPSSTLLPGSTSSASSSPYSASTSSRSRSCALATASLHPQRRDATT